jgi:PAS domain S-box-containing protein
MMGKQPQAPFGLLDDILDYVDEGVAVYDRDERLVVFNAAYAKLFESVEFSLKPGITASELASAALISGYREIGDGDADYQWFDLELSDFRAATGRPRLRRTRDGRLHSVVYSRVRDGRTAVTWTDVTEQRRFIQTLAEREEYLRQTLKIVSDGVIGIDGRGVVHSCNTAAQKIFGYDPEEIIGRNVSMLMPEPDAAAHDGYIRRYLDTGESRIIGAGREVVGLRKSGEMFPMALAIAETQASRSVKFIGTVTDLSRTREIETQLRHAEKLKAIGQLTEGIAHDFNNLLSVILVNLRKLESRDDVSIAASSQVSAALNATVKAGELSKHLLVFSHQTPLQPKVVDPAAVVADVIEMLTPILGQQIAVQVRFARELGAIKVDPAQLQNALVNLAINSRDAMSGSGTLSISVRKATPEERERSASVLSNLFDIVVLEIEDDGQGMTPEVIERAIVPFFTTKEVGEGSGLGLSMVHRFLEESGGDMQIDSQPGVGTAIRLLLPAANHNSSHAASESSEG